MRVVAVADFGGLFHCVVDGENVTVDQNITQEGIDKVNVILKYGQTKHNLSLTDAREEYACAGSVR